MAVRSNALPKLGMAPSFAWSCRSCEKNYLDQNITQVTEIRRLGRGQSIGSRCDKVNAPPPQVSEASSSNQPFNAVNRSGSSDTYRPRHSKLRRGRVEFIAPCTYRLPPSQPANLLSLCHTRDRSNFHSFCRT